MSFVCSCSVKSGFRYVAFFPLPSHLSLPLWYKYTDIARATVQFDMVNPPNFCGFLIKSFPVQHSSLSSVETETPM